eukprot:gene9615-biopygen6355
MADPAEAPAQRHADQVPDAEGVRAWARAARLATPGESGGMGDRCGDGCRECGPAASARGGGGDAEPDPSPRSRPCLLCLLWQMPLVRIPGSRPRSDPPSDSTPADTLLGSPLLRRDRAARSRPRSGLPSSVSAGVEGRGAVEGHVRGCCRAARCRGVVESGVGVCGIGAGTRGVRRAADQRRGVRPAQARLRPPRDCALRGMVRSARLCAPRDCALRAPLCLLSMSSSPSRETHVSQGLDAVRELA